MKSNLGNLQKNASYMNSPTARCQCLRSCKEAPEKGSAFCMNHMNYCPRSAPLSGWEPAYEPNRWNDKKEIRLTHNCFSYAMNVIDTKQINNCLKDPSCQTPFHQPGSISGHPKFTNTDPKTCPNMITRLMGDNQTILPSAFELKCPAGTSKFALIVDQDEDYHFLRQDSNGFFSQKSGALPVTNLDALGHEIFDVELANHNYNNRNSKLNYDRSCGYFCVPRNRRLHIKVGGYKKTRRSKKV